MLPRTRRSALVIAAAAFALTSSLTGCSALALATAQHTQVFYPTLSTAGPKAASEVPAFVPQDATDVTVRSLPGHGKTMQFVSTTALDASLCHPGELSGKPRINSNWWPTAKLPTEGTVCASGWQLFELDGTTYGWSAQ